MACQHSVDEHTTVKETKETNLSLPLQQSFAEQEKDYNTIKQDYDSTPSSTQERHCYRQKGSIREHVNYFCSLAAGAYVGVLCRIYLSELVNWDGVPLFPSLYPQLVGTVIMGFVSSHKILLASHSFLYQAIATGLCGSITTFSSWNSEAVSTLLQADQAAPNDAVRVLGWLTTLLLGLGMSTAALTLGHHLATLSPWADMKQRNKQLSEKSRCCVVFEAVVWVLVWLVMTLLVVAVPYVLRRRDLIFSCLFASLGVYIRWHLSPFNAVFKNFKLGTFLANVTGAWVLGGVVSILDRHTEGELFHDLLVGVAAGFCGCLTTVSTFAVELSSLPLWASYVYGTTSIVLAQVGLILVRGTVQWTSDV